MHLDQGSPPLRQSCGAYLPEADFVKIAAVPTFAMGELRCIPTFFWSVRIGFAACGSPIVT